MMKRFVLTFVGVLCVGLTAGQQRTDLELAKQENLAKLRAEGAQQATPVLRPDAEVPLGGGRVDPTAGVLAEDLGDIPPGIGDDGTALIFPGTRFAVNGISLRNCKRGAINLVGVPAGSTIVAAYLYWGWAGLAAPVPGIHDQVRMVRRTPTPRVKAGLKGTLIGTGADPCWAAGTSNWVYRADVLAQVPVMIAAAGGTYEIGLRPGATGTIDYSDPWATAVPPFAEGAALVVVYANSFEPMGLTTIHDAGLAGVMFLSFPGLTYNLVYPTAFSGAEARWANIGMDGQHGGGYLPITEMGDEITFDLVAGISIAGGGAFGLPSVYNDSDWNGAGNKPLGQLWDVSGHDVTTSEAVHPGFLPLIVTSPGAGGAIYDCLVPVANVMWTR